MELLLDRTDKKARENLFTDVEKAFAEPSFGETLPLSVGIIDRIAQPLTNRLWEPLTDLTGWTIRAAIGSSFQMPIAGTFTLTFGVDTTTPIDYNATAEEIETALNALNSMDNAGFCDVEEIGDGYFKVTFRDPGTRTQIDADPANLAPLSIIEPGTLIEGDSSPEIQEVQTFRIVQNPAAYAALTTDSETPDVDVDVLTTGGGGFNHKVRITFTPLPFDGKFTVAIGGMETDVLDYNIAATGTDGTSFTETLENLAITSGALVTGRKYKIVSFETGDDFANLGATNETGNVFTASGTTPTDWTNGSAVTSVGEGNVAVTKEAEGSYLLAFRGDMANTDMGDIDVDISALRFIAYKSGSLALNTPGMELLLNGEDEIDTFMEIEGTPPAGSPQKLFRRAIKVVAAVIDPSTMAPTPRIEFYSKDEVDALIAPLNGGNGGNFRIIPTGETAGILQIWNQGTSQWHSIGISGASGEEQLAIYAGEAGSTP